MVAALVAARRDDVDALVTVASPLSLQVRTEQLALSPLTQSIDPAEHVDSLASIAQLHLVGGADATVPASVLKDYIERLPAGHHAALTVIEEANHSCCWNALWSKFELENLGH